MPNLLRQKQRKRKLRKITAIALPIFLVVFIFVILPLGYLYFFETNLKADYYFQKAQKLDEANPYGSRKAIVYYSRAIKSYQALGDRGAAVNAYIHLGLLHHKFGNVMQVERMVLNAIDTGGEDIPKPLKAKAYMLLASTVEPKRAKQYINDAIYIASELKEQVLVLKSYFILARIYEYEANFNEAKNIYLKAINIAENLKPEDGFFDPENLYANLGELYYGEGANQNAINYYSKALEATRKRTEYGIDAANYMKILGDLYQANMQTAKACEDWNASKNEYRRLGKQPPMAILQLSISETCQKLG